MVPRVLFPPGVPGLLCFAPLKRALPDKNVICPEDKEQLVQVLTVSCLAAIHEDFCCSNNRVLPIKGADI
ncbi:hypothetical protein ASPCAL00092 [Aspergillus calidoustus]|uniref:Uncharacterized protein n=1 Tax=Aspergillus calidoustus TaxID=454130 RepID=A0A0U5C0E4_ASPCI|nr:hypothetical protein ASPCAL00092 [Aspergillus calidoustus]